jgi:hypothetical protein
MYRAIIFATFVAASSSFAVIRVSDGREFGMSSHFAFAVVSDEQLREVVEAAAASVDRISRANLTAEQKLQQIKMNMVRVQEYRKMAWSRSPATEYKLDLMMTVYESFPEAAEFRRNLCPQYFSTLKLDWEPTAQGVPTIRGVKRAWENLKSICEIP